MNNYNIKLVWTLIFYLITAAFMCALYFKTFKTINQKAKKSPTEVYPHAVRYFYIMLASALILRLLLAPVIEGHPIDINCFKSWASISANNLAGFYKNDMFVDYPPVYIYVLYFMANIAKLFGFISVKWAYTVIIKLPSIAADIVTAYLIYKIAGTKLSNKWAVGLSVIYAFNPVLILNSTLWGQVDSFFTMLIVSALWFIQQGKLQWSSAFFALSILMKPQGIIFLPVLFFELLRRKSIKEILKCLVYALIAAVVLIIPFSREPLWIVNLFMKTASGYKGASVNAFNFFALLGGNWKDDSKLLFILDYKTWGLIFDILVLAYSGYLYLKSKAEAIPFISSMVLISGAFVMSHRMHERYMFPVMALILLIYIFTKDKRMLAIYALASLTGFINTYVVFKLSLKEVYWVPANDPALMITSFLNVILLIYMFKVSYDIVKGKIRYNI